MIIKTLAAMVAALVATPVLAATPPVDTYRLSPEIKDGKVTALSVTITLPADADGQTRLRLPEAWGGGERLWRFIKDPVVTGGTLSIADEKTWTIASKPRARLTVRYRVISAYDGTPPVDSVNYAQPIVGPDGFYVVGQTIFVRPDGRDDRARFVWDPAGSGLRFASDLEELTRKPGMLDVLSDSVAIAYKDLTVLERDAGGAPLRVAVRGPFPFTQTAFADMAAQTIAATRAFWGDGREPFLITLMSQAAPPSRTANRGSGLGDAFAVIATPNLPLDRYRLFLAHEYFHTWNANRVGGLKDGPDEPAGYWFSEGFTDYYARRLSLRAGLVDLEAFVAAWNDALEIYAVSPVKTASNADIAARFWSDPDVRKLPYNRGSLIAVLMQHRLKAQGGLDPVMLAMRDYATGRAPAAWDHAAANLFPRIVKSRTGIDVVPELEHDVARGEALLLPADAFGGCLTVQTTTRPTYAAGFDQAATRKTLVVSGVDPKGPAYAAGLRDGMKYLGRAAGKDGDSTQEAGLGVEDAAGKRVIRYLPRGEGGVTVQRLVMPADLTPEARAACVKAVAG